jgi:hypothetical protein
MGFNPANPHWLCNSNRSVFSTGPVDQNEMAVRNVKVD